MGCPLRFAYNSNGLQSHRLDEALTMLAECGYQGIALTLDHMHLDPMRAEPSEVAKVKSWLEQKQLSVSIETGARYVLDPRRKHRPSWIDASPDDRARRSAYLERCLAIAEQLSAESVVLFSGINHDAVPEDQAWEQFLEALGACLTSAVERGLTLALEPEPGHLVATMGDFERCHEAYPDLRMALDVGHVPVTEPDRSIPETIREYRDLIAALHIEDSHGLVHEHLPLGSGCLDIAGILEALVAVDYQGLVAVELSRHSHAAHELVPASIEYLRQRLAH